MLDVPPMFTVLRGLEWCSRWGRGKGIHPHQDPYYSGIHRYVPVTYGPGSHSCPLERMALPPERASEG